jgi:hypothetical protein
MFHVAWNPSYFVDIFVIFQRFNGRAKKLLWLLFVAHSWALRLTRNKATIEAKFSRQPANLIYKTLILLQQWRILQKAEMVPLLDEAIALLKDIYYNTSSRPAGGA